MTFDLKIYVGFVIPLQNNLTKTKTKFSLTCLVWWISLKKCGFKPYHSTFRIWKFLEI
jgi:hypothetical protein